MDTIIYTLKDRQVVGYVFPRSSQHETETAIKVEIDNLIKSDLGGSARDYATVDVESARIPGKVPAINPDGSVYFSNVVDPDAKLKQAGMAKFVSLGFSEAEIKALIRI